MVERGKQMTKHSKQYFEDNHLGGFRRRRRIWGWIIAVVIIFLVVLGMVWYRMANAITINYPAIHNCIETAKYLNQIATVHLNVGGCVNNPYEIK
jgi:hypothetical protein